MSKNATPIDQPDNLRINPEHEFDLLCIGSGPAGQRAAIQAAKLGKRVAIVEKQRCVGGVCIETGTIPSKTFREAIRRFYSRPGFHEGDASHTTQRPTMQQLLSHVERTVQCETGVVQDALMRNEITVLCGRASFVDPHTVAIDNETGTRTITATNIMIAVGTTPAVPEGVTPDGQTVILSDDLLELKEIPRTLAVIGAGVIGIEYASMFAALGAQVTVIDRRPRPMEFLDGEIVDELLHQMRRKDVTFRGGEAVSTIQIVDGPPKRSLIELNSGKHIVADLTLFSIGRIGATASLNLDAAGLRADERGRLSVDEHFRTNVPHIYAAGDVIGYPALAATSSEQGRLAACYMFDAAAEPMAAHFPIGIYSIPEISMVGMTEEELTSERVPYETGVARYKEIARGKILGDDTGFFKTIFHRDTGKLLGAHCIGSGATELIHIGQAVLALGGGLDYFINTVFNYPTLAECYKVAAFNAANKLQFVRKAQMQAARAAVA